MIALPRRYTHATESESDLSGHGHSPIGIVVALDSKSPLIVWHGIFLVHDRGSPVVEVMVVAKYDIARAPSDANCIGFGPCFKTLIKLVERLRCMAREMDKSLPSMLFAFSQK